MNRCSFGLLFITLAIQSPAIAAPKGSKDSKVKKESKKPEKEDSKDKTEQKDVTKRDRVA